MFSFTISFEVTETPDGLFHVQNWVGPFRGQHHVHTAKGLKNWMRKADINKKHLRIRKGECNCGLKPGDVREYDGQVWHNNDFE